MFKRVRRVSLAKAIPKNLLFMIDDEENIDESEFPVKKQ
jgi:hypothetical protein